MLNSVTKYNSFFNYKKIYSLIINTDNLASRYRWGERFKNIAGYMTPVLAATIETASNIDKTSHPTIHSYFLLIKDYSLYGYAGMLCIFFTGVYLSKKGNAVCWEAMQVQIDELQSIAFEKHQAESNEKHRVTLFRYKRWCWRRHGWNLLNWAKSYKVGISPASGWLVPVLRSGHMSKNTKTIFAAPDEGSLIEGVAGQCWASDYTTYVERLPSLSRTSNDNNIEKYCTGTKLPKEFVRQYISNDKKLSRSLLAMPVKDSNGCRWGVVVFDSQHASGIDKIETEKAFRAIINTLGVLVGDLK